MIEKAELITASLSSVGSSIGIGVVVSAAGIIAYYHLYRGAWETYKAQGQMTALAVNHLVNGLLYASFATIITVDRFFFNLF